MHIRTSLVVIDFHVMVIMITTISTTIVGGGCGFACVCFLFVF